MALRSQRSRQSKSQAAYKPPRAPRGWLNVPGELWHQARRRGSHRNIPITATFPPPRCSHHQDVPTTTTSSPPPPHHPHHHHGINPTTTTASLCSTCRERGLLGLVVSSYVRRDMHAQGVRMWLHAPMLPPTPPRMWGAQPDPHGDLSLVGSLTPDSSGKPPRLTRSPPSPFFAVPGCILPLARGRPSPVGQRHHFGVPVRRVPTRVDVVAPESFSSSLGSSYRPCAPAWPRP